MSLKQQIETDLKTALLEGNKETTSVLRGLKSVILNEEIATGAREAGLSDDAVLAQCRKEAKSVTKPQSYMIKLAKVNEPKQNAARNRLSRTTCQRP